MREWLTVIIVLLIAGILLDGLRRMRQAHRNGLRVSRKARKLDAESLPDPNTEVCSEPRVVRQRDHDDAQSLTKNMRETFAKSRVTAGAPKRMPEQVSLNLQQAVPMLMDSVDDQAQPEPDYTQPPAWADAARPLGEARPVGDSAADAPATETANDDASYDEAEQWHQEQVREPSLGDMNAFAEDTDAVAEPVAADETDVALEDPVAEAPQRTEPEPAPSRSAQREPEPAPEPQEVLIINITAPSGTHFEGASLLQALLDQGLRFGAMDIFHRHKFPDGSGPVWFSLANMVVPGTFDLSAMDEFSTPGVSLFLSLPNADDNLAAFDCMAQTARALADMLGGELKDENRSVMTRQTLEHCRQRVLEFERKQRLMQRSL